MIDWPVSVVEVALNQFVSEWEEGEYKLQCGVLSPRLSPTECSFNGSTSLH